MYLCSADFGMHAKSYFEILPTSCKIPVENFSAADLPRKTNTTLMNSKRTYSRADQQNVLCIVSRENDLMFDWCISDEL